MTTTTTMMINRFLLTIYNTSLILHILTCRCVSDGFGGGVCCQAQPSGPMRPGMPGGGRGMMMGMPPRAPFSPLPFPMSGRMRGMYPIK